MSLGAVGARQTPQAWGALLSGCCHRCHPLLNFQDGISPSRIMLSWIKHFHVNLPFASLAWRGRLEPPLEMGFIFPAPSVQVLP